MKNVTYIITILSLLSHLSGISQTADKYLIKAALLSDQKQYSQALEAATLSTATNNAGYPEIMGTIEFGLKNYDKAIEYFTQAQKTKSGNYQIELAKCYAQSGNKQKAIQTVSTYLKSDHKLPISKIINDENFKDLKSSPEWEKMWQSADYSEQEISINRVNNASEIGYQENFESTLNDALLKYPSNPDLLLQQSKYLMSTHQPDAAQSAINRAIAIKPGNDRLYYQKAMILKKNNNPKEALSAINSAINNNPFVSAYYLLRVEVNKTLGDADKVKEDLDLMEFSLPDLPEVKMVKIQANYDKGDYMNALAGLNELIKSDQSKPEYFTLRGKIDLKSERYQNADYDFGMALDLNPSDVDANVGKGLAKLKQQDTNGACFYWQVAAQKGNREAQRYLIKYCGKN
jgi:tetratricopeptide (TPR) repeat protein